MVGQILCAHHSLLHLHVSQGGQIFSAGQTLAPSGPKVTPRHTKGLIRGQSWEGSGVTHTEACAHFELMVVAGETASPFLARRMSFCAGMDSGLAISPKEKGGGY